MPFGVDSGVASPSFVVVMAIPGHPSDTVLITMRVLSVPVHRLCQEHTLPSSLLITFENNAGYNVSKLFQSLISNLRQDGY